MLLKTTITFIFIFPFVCLGGNIFLLPFYPSPGLAFGEKDIGHPAIYFRIGTSFLLPLS
jgi:hypothetical protein